MVRRNSAGDLADLLPGDVEKYTRLFEKPETFPPGQWRIRTRTEETENCRFFRITSEWAADEGTKEEPYVG